MSISFSWGLSKAGRLRSRVKTWKSDLRSSFSFYSSLHSMTPVAKWWAKMAAQVDKMSGQFFLARRIRRTPAGHTVWREPQRWESEKKGSLNSVKKYHLNAWAKNAGDHPKEGSKGVGSWTEIWDFCTHTMETQQTNMAKPEKHKLRSEPLPREGEAYFTVGIWVAYLPAIININTSRWL